MSARLKLKNLKKHINGIDNLREHYLSKVARVNRILNSERQTIGCNIELRPVNCMGDALQELDRTVNKAGHDIAQIIAKQLSEFIRNATINKFRFDHYTSFAIRVIMPKPTNDVILVEPIVPRRFF